MHESNVRFGTVLQEDGKIAVGAIENDKVVAQHAFDQNGAVAFGAHLLNTAKAAQKEPLPTHEQCNGVVYDVKPGAIPSMAAGTGRTAADGYGRISHKKPSNYAG